MYFIAKYIHHVNMYKILKCLLFLASNKTVPVVYTIYKAINVYSCIFLYNCADFYVLILLNMLLDEVMY